jgi:hypothetical protein
MNTTLLQSQKAAYLARFICFRKHHTQILDDHSFLRTGSSKNVRLIGALIDADFESVANAVNLHYRLR